MKFLIVLPLLIGINANANILKETRTQNVNQSSVHVDCKLKNMSNSIFSSYSRVIIKTDFGDDSPEAYAFDNKNRPVEDLTLNDFSEHSQMKMRVFVLENYKEKIITNLIVQYTKTGSKISASAVLTTNGKSYPGVVNNQEMVCEYLGKMAINN